MGTELEVKGKGRTGNWSIVKTILNCCIVNVKRIHIHRTLVVVVYVAASGVLLVVILPIMDATVTVVMHL